jgi:hypothetical protein
MSTGFSATDEREELNFLGIYGRGGVLSHHKAYLKKKLEKFQEFFGNSLVNLNVIYFDT